MKNCEKFFFYDAIHIILLYWTKEKIAKRLDLFVKIAREINCEKLKLQESENEELQKKTSNFELKLLVKTEFRKNNAQTFNLLFL